MLALSQNAARLVQASPDEPPVTSRSRACRATPRARWQGLDHPPLGGPALQGSEGKKVRLRQYARRVEEALRPLLSGLDLPLVLAATEPLASISEPSTRTPISPRRHRRHPDDDRRGGRRGPRARRAIRRGAHDLRAQTTARAAGRAAMTSPRRARCTFARRHGSLTSTRRSRFVDERRPDAAESDEP